jgi:hypothetical protein
MLLFFVIASVATCPPKLNERRRKQSILAKQKLGCFVAEPVITVRAQLRSSRGAHSRDPLDPLRKRFAFVAGNDGL